MRKRLFIAMLICMIYTVTSQEYTPLLSDTNEWKLTSCFMGSCITDTYYTDGEISVNGFTHKVLDGYHYINRTFYLREDITTKQVFMTVDINGSIREYLLYDFSLSVGDEFEMKNPFTPFPEDGGPFRLEEITMVLMADGNEYRQFRFTPTANNTVSTEDAIWIEGVGSLSIINAPGGAPDFDAVGHLSCSFRDRATFYTNFQIIDVCEPRVLAIEDVGYNHEPMILVRDGVLEVLNMQRFIALSVFDIGGRELENASFSQEKRALRIATNSYPSGMYLLVLKTANGFGTVTKKVVVY